MQNVGTENRGDFTHFASADEGDDGKEYTLGQFNKFIYSIRYIEAQGIKYNIRHCANSAGIIEYPEMHLDMVRAGIVLYGLQSLGDIHNTWGLQNVKELKTIIDHVKNIHKGDCISYGREIKAEHAMRIVTIPIGYADGLWSSNYHNRMVVEVNGKPAPIIGCICMDQCMIDVSDIPEADVTREVTVYGTSAVTSVNHIAKANNIIHYEITCAVGERVPRVYIENDLVVKVMDNIV